MNVSLYCMHVLFPEQCRFLEWQEESLHVILFTTRIKKMDQEKTFLCTLLTHHQAGTIPYC